MFNAVLVAQFAHQMHVKNLKKPGCLRFFLLHFGLPMAATFSSKK